MSGRRIYDAVSENEALTPRFLLIYDAGHYVEQVVGVGVTEHMAADQLVLELVASEEVAAEQVHTWDSCFGAGGGGLGAASAGGGMVAAQGMAGAEQRLCPFFEI
jgi:hypothetical protein